MLTPSCNDRTIQAARDLRRSLVQPSAQSRVRSETESGFIHMGLLRVSSTWDLKTFKDEDCTASLGSHCLTVPNGEKVSPYTKSLHCSSGMSSLLSQAGFLIQPLVFLHTTMVLC